MFEIIYFAIAVIVGGFILFRADTSTHHQVDGSGFTAVILGLLWPLVIMIAIGAIVWFKVIIHEE